MDAHDIPVVAVVDPDMMSTMTASLTAATGMDALTHAIEGYITKGAWELSDMFHIKAIEIISVRFVTRSRTARPAAKAWRWASMWPVWGFSNVGLGVDHSMAHTLSAYYDTPHGKACAILLPAVMALQRGIHRRKIQKDIASAMGVEGVDSMTPAGYRKAAVAAVRKLSEDVGIPSTLKGIVKGGGHPCALAESAYADAGRPGNPRDTSVEEIAEIYRSLM